MRRERFAPTLVAQPPEPRTIDTEPESEGSSAAWLPSAELMQRCLALLSEQQTHCLELAFVDGHSHEDIARLVGSPLGTVKSWIRRGLRSLRQCLES
jgi:RNA polymerase sigma-70 factor, ECF subfamily